MNKKDIRKIIASVISCAMILTTPGYIYGQGLGETVYQAQTYLSQNAFYEEQIAINKSQAVQHIYTVDTTINDSVMPYVFVGDVARKSSLSYMKGLLAEEGYTVIAGINGDFFDTSTSVPLGMSMHEGKMKNSGLNNSNALGFNADGTAFVAPVLFNYTFTVNEETVYTFDHINKPKGISNSLHFYNRQYAETTQTITNSIEVVFEALDSSEPVINDSIHGVVIGINDNTKNTAIGDNHIVLSAGINTPGAETLSNLIIGDHVSFTVTDETGMWQEATEAIGAYEIIAQNGVVSTTNTALNPRTALGIKKDGGIMLYTVDGRRPGYSLGMNLTDIATYMVERGCETVINMDGGGSTTMLARMPGEEDAKLMNLPSDGKERSVSNALFLVSKNQGSGITNNLHLYPLTTFMMPGAQVQFTTKATDEMYTPAPLPDHIVYEVENGMGHINSDGLFTAGETTGKGQIIAESGGFLASASINITQDISIYPDKTNIIIDPGKTVDINVTALSGYVPVTSSDNLFTWSLDAHLGNIDQNGVFVATNKSSVSGNISIAYNGITKTIPVQVGLSEISYTDIQDHWAQNNIELLTEKGIVKGMGNNQFLPDAQITRAQFLTMISNTIVGLDTNTAEAANFTDVQETDWYAPYVNWAYEHKIISGNPDGTFSPDAPITREEMAIILNNFTTSTGMTFSDIIDSVSFIDENLVSPWALNGVIMVANTGIMNGRPEGNFDPQGFATRAEASKVVFNVISFGEK